MRRKILRTGEQKDRAGCTKFQVLAWMIINSRRSLNQWENYPMSAHKLSWNACTWHELVDQTSHGQQSNLLDPSQNGQEHATDDWCAWSPTFITQVTTSKGNTVQHCRLGSFQDSDFAGDLEDSKSTSAGILCNFGSRTLVTVSWMCKKQTSVSHSSTESEIISLDAGLRMDELLALDLWDVMMEVFRLSNQYQNTPTNPAAGKCSRNHKSKGN